MKFHFSYCAALLLSCLAGSAVADNDSKIVTIDGRVIKTSKIEQRENGDLEYLSPDGKVKNRIARGRFRYAEVPKPASVTAADQKFREQQWNTAAALYRKAGTDYKLLGWNAYCVRMEAEARVRSGEKDKAVQLLQNLHDEREINPDQSLERAKADNLLADLRIDRKEFAEAEKLLNRQLHLEDPALVFSAYFKKAVILQRQGKRKQAAILFYQTALLFPSSSRRAEALFNTWSILTELKAPDAAKIAAMLKREYPNSPYAKQVFF